MGRTYTLTDADSGLWEDLSVKLYGEKSFANVLRGANPETAGGFRTGMVINVPEVAPRTPTEIISQTGDEVAIKVNGRLFRFWSTFELIRGIDSIAQFSFTAPFEPDNEEFREVFKPFQYQDVEVFVGGTQLYRGTLVDLTPSTAVDGGRVVTASGYSRCGVLQDCNIPASVFADELEAGGGLEWDDLTLRQIAAQMVKEYGLFPVFEDSPQAPIPDEGDDPEFAWDSVAISVSQKIWNMWTPLALQRNLVIGDDEGGNPVFRRSSSSPPIQTIEESQSPFVSITPEFESQNYFSSVTGFNEYLEGQDGTQHTEPNPHLRGVLRPHSFEIPDAENAAQAVHAIRAKLARMFGSAVKWRVHLGGGMRDVNGDLWQPNTSIRLLAPAAFIYAVTHVLIREVVLAGTHAQQTASLQVVLPGSFEGKIPEVMPWD